MNTLVSAKNAMQYIPLYLCTSGFLSVKCLLLEYLGFVIVEDRGENTMDFREQNQYVALEREY